MAVPECLHGGCRSEESEISVEEYLNLPKDLPNVVEEDEEEAIGDVSGGISADSSSAVRMVDSCTSSLSVYENHSSGDLNTRSGNGIGFSSDLCEPYDQLAELQWVANIVDVEDSHSNDDLQNMPLISPVKPSSPMSSNSLLLAEQTVQPPPVFLDPETQLLPGKVRSKRCLAVPCDLSSHLKVLSHPPATPSSSSESKPNGAIEVAQNATRKKIRKLVTKKDPTEGPNYADSNGRKCLHCATDKTPQWRTGPMGPKTLCNACGVRYKSGRLVPEYRPATSPTFVASKHSNSHRKVLELRRQKESLQQQPAKQQVFLHAGGAVFNASSGNDLLLHDHIYPDFQRFT